MSLLNNGLVVGGGGASGVSQSSTSNPLSKQSASQYQHHGILLNQNTGGHRMMTQNGMSNPANQSAQTSGHTLVKSFKLFNSNTIAQANNTQLTQHAGSQNMPD